jgi:hypothetical protein
VNAEDLASDDRSDGKGIENINECLPGLHVGTPLALVIEPIDCHQLMVIGETYLW